MVANSGDALLHCKAQGRSRPAESCPTRCVSAAALWEAALKASLGKIEAGPHALIAAIDASGFTELPVRSAHAAGVTRLAPPHHNDPFDRLLIAQALAEPLALLTADTLPVRYSDLVVLV
jgi:PIN domain nuclease of toxin-antitoxin system